MRLLTLVIIGGLLSACSLLQAPDRSRIEPMDASVMADADADALMDSDADAETSIDGGDGGDSCPDGGCPMDEVCDDGFDNDLDGLIDCNDFDCTADPDCCGEMSLALEIDWEGLAGVRRFPDGSYPITDVESGVIEPRHFLQNFGPEGRSSGFITRSCQSMMLGLHINGTFQPRAGCAGDGCYVAIVLTGALSAVGGAPLIDDLAIRMNAQGQVQITQGPDSLVDWTDIGVAPNDEIPISIDVTPGQYEDGEPALVATLRAHTSEGPVTLLEATPFISLSDLDREGSSCRGVPGLRIGVEGSGNAIRVYGLTTNALECVNPSHFVAAPDGDVTLRPGSEPGHLLNLGDWASGGLGSPALLSTCASDECWRSGGVVRWDLLVEASNINLESETFTHVGYSIDHGVSDTWDDRDTWFTGEDVEPRLGENPPSCLDVGGTPTCDGHRSVRDPAVWTHRTSAGRIGLEAGTSARFYLAYSKERFLGSGGTEVDRGHFAIHIDEIPVEPGVDIEEGRAKIDVDVHGLREDFGCVSIRDPSLSRATTSTRVEIIQTDFWLLYTCVREGAPESILLSEFTSSWIYRMGQTREVLRPEDLGPYAAGGVWGPEMVVDWDDEANRPRVRIWFMARSMDRRVSMGLVQGEGVVVVYPGPDEPPVLYEFPDLVEFGGNPVLDADHDALWRMGEMRPPGTRLLGFAVASMGNNSPEPGALRRLRFLVARRVNRMGSWTSELVPLGQSWRSP